MIRAYMVDDFIIHKWNGYDKWGEPKPCTLIDVKGYIKYKMRLVRNIKGEEVVSIAMVYFSKPDMDALLSRALLHMDRIQTSTESYSHAIIQIDTPKAFSDPHYEVYIS